jgi:hypothetical protein
VNYQLIQGHARRTYRDTFTIQQKKFALSLSMADVWGNIFLCLTLLLKIVLKMFLCRNKNNFQTETDCQSFCAAKKFESKKFNFIVISFSCINKCIEVDNEETCDLPPDTGMCTASFQRFYFDSSTQSCKQFTYGGCLGNSNRFETKEYVGAFLAKKSFIFFYIFSENATNSAALKEMKNTIRHFVNWINYLVHVKLQ